MSDNEDSSDYRLDRKNYPYFTEDEFENFRVGGKEAVQKVHLSCRKRYETRIAKYSIDHDESRNLEIDLNIVLLGKTGSGKSSTGNAILGRKAFKVDSSSNSVNIVSLDNECTYKNRRITVVDTPAIHDTGSNKATVAKELARMAFLLKDGVHCFIICMSASDSRFPKELIEMLMLSKVLYKLDGQGNFFDYCMLAYTKAETELETCTLGEFLKQGKENNTNRLFVEYIKDRVVAVNNNCLLPAEALRNRGALIRMVDVVVAENIRQGHPDIFTNYLFEKAGWLRNKLTSVEQDHSRQVMVNAAIEVVIHKTSFMLPFDTFLKKVISILRRREFSEEINQFPDLFFTGTDRVYAKYVNQIHQIYDEMEPEFNVFKRVATSALVLLTGSAVAGETAATALEGAVAAIEGAAGSIYSWRLSHQSHGD